MRPCSSPRMPAPPCSPRPSAWPGASPPLGAQPQPARAVWRPPRSLGGRAVRPAQPSDTPHRRGQAEGGLGPRLVKIGGDAFVQAHQSPVRPRRRRRRRRLRALVPALQATAAAHQWPHAAAGARGAGRRGPGSLRRSPHPLAWRHRPGLRIGFCHGQDRLWQLEFFRRAVAGRLCEFAGPDMLHVDSLMRALGLYRTAQRETTELDAAVRTRLTAYAAGINAAIEKSAALPIEFQILRLEPEPWSLSTCSRRRSCLRWAVHQLGDGALRAALVREAGRAAARLEPQYPRANPVVRHPGAGLRRAWRRHRGADRGA